MIQLIDFEDLERTLGEATAPLDKGLAGWVIETVSVHALDITGQDWAGPEDTPPIVRSIVTLAARRLYTNPDRMTREAEDGYSYGLDRSVTDAEVFTPSEAKRLGRFAIPEYRRLLEDPQLGTVSTYRGDAREPRRWATC